MADKIAVEPSGVCMNSAFHSSATGQDNYVGFGAKFHPNMPLTTSDVGDRTTSARGTGSRSAPRPAAAPTSQPVFVEILTKETQPTTAGGVATSQAVDLYNNRGVDGDYQLHQLSAVLRAVRCADPALAAGGRLGRQRVPGGQ